MSSVSLCGLCLSAHTKFKSLYDKNDQENIIYEITVKYFDPNLLKSKEYPHVSMSICIKCWQHISDFHNFQQSVLTAHKTLLQDSIEVDIKLEDDLPIEKEADINNEHNGQKIASEICLSQLNVTEIKNEINFPSDIGSNDDLPSTQNGRSKRITKMEQKQAIQEKAEKTDHLQSTLEESGTIQSGEKHKIKKDKQHINDSSNLSSNCNDSEDGSVSIVSSNNMKKTANKKRKEIDAFIAEWKPELECDLCKQYFPNLTLLRRHFSSDHSKVKCYVLCCQQKLVQRFHIVEHIRYHMDSNTFKCDICDKTFLNSRNLGYHKRDQHTISGQERSFECFVCQKRFLKKGALKAHIETHNADKTYKCGQCEKGFSTEQRLKIHVRSVHNIDRVCDQCGKTIHGEAALKQHMLKHAGVQKQKWPCDQCGAKLTSHYSLKRHRRIHDTSTTYVCNECGKTVSTEIALQSHKKYSHQLERNLKCTICNKAFKVAHVLREHMATHTGEDLYKCPHCPQTFRANANMHHHRKKVHPKEWIEGRTRKMSKTIELITNKNVM